MNRKSGFLRALVLGGTIATVIALNSTNVYAAEEDAEQLVSSEQIEEQNEEVQEASCIEKMEDAVEVIEGDAVTEEGYLETASEAIEKKELTEEQEDELTKNGKEVLDQAEEKNNIVKEEYGNVVEETQADKEAFDEAAEAVGLSDYVEQVEEAATNEEKIEIIEEAEESLAPTKEEVDRVIEEIASLEDQIKTLEEEIAEYEKEMSDTVWVFEAEKNLPAVQQQYDEEVAKYNEFKSKLQECQENLVKLEKDYQGCLGKCSASKADYEEACNYYGSLLKESYEYIEKANQAIAACKEEIDRLEKELEQTTDEEKREEIIMMIESEKQVIRTAIYRIGIEKDYVALYEEQESWCKGEYERYLKGFLKVNNDISDTNLEIVSLNERIVVSESVQRELKDKLEFDYASVKAKYFLAAARSLVAEEECSPLREKLSGINVEEYREKDILLQNFFNAAENYKNSLRVEIKAKALVERSESAYTSVASTYKNLVSAIENYKETDPVNPDNPETNGESHSVDPVEPEIKEETYVETYTTTISEKVSDIFTGITAVVEANVTTKVTKAVKTIKDVATNVTKTVVTTNVDVEGSGTIKFYSILGALITALAGSFKFGFNRLGGLFA